MQADILARIEARVPALAGRMRGAAEFTALVASNDIGQVQAGGYVIAMSLTGGATRAATSAFVQDVEEGITVILTQRSDDPLGRGVRDWIVTQRDAVIGALAGWTPAGSPGPVRLRRAQMLPNPRGVLVCQIDLSVPTQLRINPA